VKRAGQSHHALNLNVEKEKNDGSNEKKVRKNLVE
jgi:hypothetical protein